MYIGSKPTNKPLTSADIEDGVISAADLGANSVDSSELVDGSIDTSHLGDDQVTYAKIQNVSATDRILGRDSASAGVIEEITPANLRTMINVADGATAGAGVFVETGSLHEIGAGDATVEVTNCFSSTYDVYMIQLNILPSTNAVTLNMRAMDSSTPHEANVHKTLARYYDSDGNSSENSENTNTEFRIADSVSSREYDGGAQYTIWCYMNRDRTASQSFSYTALGNFSHSNSSGRIHAMYGAGRLETDESTDNVTGIQFFFGSGNVENIALKIWGLSGTDAV